MNWKTPVFVVSLVVIGYGATVIWHDVRRGVFARVPEEADVRLLGDWYAYRGSHWKRFTFLEGSLGETMENGEESRSFTWGTFDSTLKVKYFVNEACLNPSYHFEVLEGKGHLKLEGVGGDDVFWPDMYRDKKLAASVGAGR